MPTKRQNGEETSPLELRIMMKEVTKVEVREGIVFKENYPAVTLLQIHTNDGKMLSITLQGNIKTGYPRVYKYAPIKTEWEEKSDNIGNH